MDFHQAHGVPMDYNHPHSGMGFTEEDDRFYEDEAYWDHVHRERELREQIAHNRAMMHRRMDGSSPYGGHETPHRPMMHSPYEPQRHIP